MPMPEFRPPQGQQDTGQLQDYIVKLIRDLNFLLGNLDTVNVNRLDAKVINTGTLNAALVTIKSMLAGSAYIQLDSTGFKAYNGSINTVAIDNTGTLALHSSLTGSAYITLDSTGFKAYNGSINTVNIDNTGSLSLRSNLAGSAYITLDSTGLKAWNGSINTVNIDSTGTANFTGNITGGTITGTMFRTGVVGTNRIEINGGMLTGYTSANQKTGLYFDTGTIPGTGLTDLHLYHNDTDLLIFYDNIDSYTIKPGAGASKMWLGSAGNSTLCEGNWRFDNNVGFFGTTPAAKTGVGTLSAATATGAYGANEQTMLQNVYNKMNSLLNSLISYGLV